MEIGANEAWKVRSARYERRDQSVYHILNQRAGDTSHYVEMVKNLIQGMYAENPAWLEANNICPPQ